MTKRHIAEVVKDLRKATGLTQQAFATLLGWSISTNARFEGGGARPSLKSMSQMLDLAKANGLAELAAELRLHLNARLGPDFPLSPDPQEKLCVLLARRINQNPERREAFMRFAAPEYEQLLLENEIRKDHNVALWEGLDAWNEREKARQKAKGKKA